MRWALIAAAVWTIVASAQTTQPPVFRTSTETVFVNASVKKGNNPVLGLQAAEFVLLDNGVRQRVDAVAIENVPIDVSVFMDTSGSTAGSLDQMKANVRDIAGMLRPVDKFRLFTIGHSVHQSVPWTDGVQPLDALDIWPTHHVSLVYDAVHAATAHSVAPGRRHLVVALTDGEDACSVLTPEDLRQLIGITESVVHWIPMRGQGPGGGRSSCDKKASTDSSALLDLAKGTGGDIHSGVLGGAFGTNATKAFRKVLDDYRQSYVLRYTPEGVERRGWHALKVDVTSGKYTIRARSGYLGG